VVSLASLGNQGAPRIGRRGLFGTFDKREESGIIVYPGVEEHLNN
jgi:hypothetical protein